MKRSEWRKRFIEGKPVKIWLRDRLTRNEENNDLFSFNGNLSNIDQQILLVIAHKTGFVIVLWAFVHEIPSSTLKLKLPFKEKHINICQKLGSWWKIHRCKKVSLENFWLKRMRPYCESRFRSVWRQIDFELVSRLSRNITQFKRYKNMHVWYDESESECRKNMFEKEV